VLFSTTRAEVAATRFRVNRCCRYAVTLPASQRDEIIFWAVPVPIVLTKRRFLRTEPLVVDGQLAQGTFF
jgi:hypothetical protein